MRLRARNGGAAGGTGAGASGARLGGARGRGRDTWASRNGFKAVARDAAGVGLLVIDRFDDTPQARATAHAAMRFLAGTSHLVVDVRPVDGGEASMIARLTSLLFDTEAFDADETVAVPDRLAVTSEERCATQLIEVLVTRDSHFLALAFALNLVRLGRATVRLMPVPEARCCA